MSTLLDQCHDQMSAAQLVAHHEADETKSYNFADGDDFIPPFTFDSERVSEAWIIRVLVAITILVCLAAVVWR